MQIVADVGNTEIVVGLLTDEARTLGTHWRLSTEVPRTADEFRHLLGSLLSEEDVQVDTIKQGVIGSVVPPVTRMLRTALESLIPGEVLVIDANSPLPIRLEVKEPETVGADRIVNTLAAKELFGRDTITVDLGTATTFDCISADGAFMGGVIAPGVEAGLDWLGRRTAMLPRVELSPPERVIGQRTEACIQSGVFYSAVDAIDGAVRRIKEEWGRPDAFVVATGGHAGVLAPHCTSIDSVEPFLTLHGLGLAGLHMAK